MPATPPEVQSTEWAGEPGLALGHPFRGTNRNEALGEWTTTSEGKTATLAGIHEQLSATDPLA